MNNSKVVGIHGSSRVQPMDGWMDVDEFAVFEARVHIRNRDTFRFLLTLYSVHFTHLWLF